MSLSVCPECKCQTWPDDIGENHATTCSRASFRFVTPEEILAENERRAAAVKPEDVTAGLDRIWPQPAPPADPIQRIRETPCPDGHAGEGRFCFVFHRLSDRDEMFCKSRIRAALTPPGGRL